MRSRHSLLPWHTPGRLPSLSGPFHRATRRHERPPGIQDGHWSRHRDRLGKLSIYGIICLLISRSSRPTAFIRSGLVRRSSARSSWRLVLDGNHRRCHCWNSLKSSSRSRLVSGRVPLASRELKNDSNFDLSSASTFSAGFILARASSATRYRAQPGTFPARFISRHLG